jgi:hypothetical protein
MAGFIDFFMMLLHRFLGGPNAAIGPTDNRSSDPGDLNMTDGQRDFASKAIDAVPGDVKMISGCKDSQTSADVHDVSQFGLPASPPGAGGACTNALLLGLRNIYIYIFAS